MYPINNNNDISVHARILDVHSSIRPASGLPFGELIIADGLCPDIAGLLPEAAHETVSLGRQFDPILAITGELNSRREAGVPVHTLHIVAHGRSGAFRLGGYWVDRDALIDHAVLIAGWQVQNIALWSCEVGADSSFIRQLAELTGAVIWASASALGAANTSLLNATKSSETQAVRLHLQDIFSAVRVNTMNFTLAAVGIALTAGSDTGVSSSDAITRDTTPTFRFTLLPDLIAGDAIQLKLGSTVVGAATLTSANITAGYVDVTTSALTAGVKSLATSMTYAARTGAFTPPHVARSFCTHGGYHGTGSGQRGLHAQHGGSDL